MVQYGINNIYTIHGHIKFTDTHTVILYSKYIQCAINSKQQAGLSIGYRFFSSFTYICMYLYIYKFSFFHQVCVTHAHNFVHTYFQCRRHGLDIHFASTSSSSSSCMRITATVFLYPKNIAYTHDCTLRYFNIMDTTQYNILYYIWCLA